MAGLFSTTFCANESNQRGFIRVRTNWIAITSMLRRWTRRGRRKRTVPAFQFVVSTRAALIHFQMEFYYG
jgi:hypothetical protein